MARYAVEGTIQASHFEWKHPTWLYKALCKFGVDKRKCGVTILDKVAITSASLVDMNTTYWVDWDYDGKKVE